MPARKTATAKKTTATRPKSTEGAKEEGTPIGTVEEALKSEIPTVEADVEDASEKERDTETEAKILSLAQLRDYHIKHGTASTPEEVEKVRELEKEIYEQGGEKLRVNEETK